MARTTMVLSLSVLALVGCSSNSSSTSSTLTPVSATTSIAETSAPATTAAPTTTAGSSGEVDADGNVAQASAVNAFVLATVLASGNDGLDPEFVAIAIKAQYPSLAVTGYAVDADPGSVSIMSTSLSSKSGPSAENPYIVAVASQQTSGACHGAAVYGYPLPTEQFEVVEPSPCNAGAVLDALTTQL